MWYGSIMVRITDLHENLYGRQVLVYWWSRRHQTKPRTMHLPSQQQLHGIGFNQTSEQLPPLNSFPVLPRLICSLWTDLVAHPGASDSSFPLMNYGAVYKLNEWLIDWKLAQALAVNSAIHLANMSSYVSLGFYACWLKASQRRWAHLQWTLWNLLHVNKGYPHPWYDL